MEVSLSNQTRTWPAPSNVSRRGSFVGFYPVQIRRGGNLFICDRSISISRWWKSLSSMLDPEAKSCIVYAKSDHFKLSLNQNHRKEGNWVLLHDVIRDNLQVKWEQYYLSVSPNKSEGLSLNRFGANLQTTNTQHIYECFGYNMFLMPLFTKQNLQPKSKKMFDEII